MRTTGNMLINNMVNYISTNQKRMSQYQYQLATGKKIRVPSDDPVVAARALKLRTDVAEIAQFKKNAKDAQSWLEVSETAISNMGDILHRANEIAVQASNETFSEDDRQKAKSEVEQLENQLIHLANTNYNGRYLFSGYKTDQKLLYEDDNLTAVPPIQKGMYRIDVSKSENIQYEIGVGDSIEVNVLGGILLSKPGGDASKDTVPTILGWFKDFIKALDTDSTTGIQAAIDDTTEALGHILQVRADIGARVNRVELTMNRLDDANLNFTGLMSENEDIDEAETIMLLKNEENVYRASLAGGARIIQTSLVDFLK